jgi:Holliday junction DNA helicase RuvB
MHGLDEMDNKILTTIIDKFKVGLDYLGLAVSRETVEEYARALPYSGGFLVAENMRSRSY